MDEACRLRVNLSVRSALAPYALTRIVPLWYYSAMPRKIRELIRDLTNAGFVDRGGKGSHRNFMHPSGIRITLSGNPSQDAKRYQERDVQQALREVTG